MAATDVVGADVALELDDIQGLVARGYGNLTSACFLLATIEDPVAARNWLGALADSLAPASAHPQDQAVHVAFSHGAMAKLGLSVGGPDDFSTEFVQGMVTANRRRMLGDVGESAPELWAWGGPATPEVDVLLALYTRDAGELVSLRDDHAARMVAGGMSRVTILDTRELDAFEHFGFHDGVSQPIIEGLTKKGAWAETVRAGEFVLGYPNEYGLLTSSPSVAAAADPRGLLPPHPAGEGFRDFGRNGSYVVLRQLRQFVHRFWRYADEAADASEGADGTSARDALAAKMVGRWRSGAPLVLSPEHDDERLADANGFTYQGPDPDGLLCPIGSHVRRANPRDSLDPNPGSRDSVAVGKRHRLLRRGRGYGTRIDPLAALEGDDGSEDERGLHFLCLNANLSRQFEFVQHTWIDNPHFDGLYEDPDPLVGVRAGTTNAFTIQADPVRRRVRNMPEFVSVRGGAYFFMPGIRAIRYLADRGA